VGPPPPFDCHTRLFLYFLYRKSSVLFFLALLPRCGFPIQEQLRHYLRCFSFGWRVVINAVFGLSPTPFLNITPGTEEKWGLSAIFPFPSFTLPNLNFTPYHERHNQSGDPFLILRRHLYPLIHILFRSCLFLPLFKSDPECFFGNGDVQTFISMVRFFSPFFLPSLCVGCAAR